MRRARMKEWYINTDYYRYIKTEKSYFTKFAWEDCMQADKNEEHVTS
jgi:hypothetical protein